MTSKTLVYQPSGQGSDSLTALSHNSSTLNNRIFTSVQTHYRSSHQAEFLDITAQVESLLAELQTLNQG